MNAGLVAFSLSSDAVCWGRGCQWDCDKRQRSFLVRSPFQLPRRDSLGLVRFRMALLNGILRRCHKPSPSTSDITISLPILQNKTAYRKQSGMVGMAEKKEGDKICICMVQHAREVHQRHGLRANIVVSLASPL